MNITTSALTWGMLLLGVLMNVIGIYAVKVKMNALGSMGVGSIGAVVGYLVELVKSPSALIGGVLVMAAPLPYAVALSRMQLSIAYPISIALNFLVILPITVIFLGEALTINKLLGGFLILVSIYLLYK